MGGTYEPPRAIEASCGSLAISRVMPAGWREWGASRHDQPPRSCDLGTGADAIARYGGMFKSLTAVDLGVTALKALLDRTGIPPEAVADVILGTVTPIARRRPSAVWSRWMPACR